MPEAPKTRQAEGKPDSELYASFLDGETEAYDQLMVRYGDSLTMFLYGYLHDWQTSEDLMIEAFARIMAKRPRIGEGNFKAYLYKTGHNLAIRHQKRRAQLRVFSVDGMEQELAESMLFTGAVSNAASSSGAKGYYVSQTEDELQKKESRQALHKCLDRIDPELREALWLVYFEDMTYAQAAEVLGVKAKRVDRLLTRGKEQMRKELMKEGVTDAH